MIEALLHFLYWLIGLFMAPGYMLLHRFAILWGKGVPPHAQALTAFLVAFVFWAILFSILGAMQAQVSGFLNRNKPRE